MVASHLSHENSTKRISTNKAFSSKRSIQQSIGQKFSNSHELPKTQLRQHADRFGRRNLHRNLQLHHETTASPASSRFTNRLKRNRTEKAPNNRLKTARIARNSKNSIESSNERWKTSNYRLKPKRTVENSKSPNKPRTNGGKLEFTEQKLERTVENGCTSTQPHRSYRNLKNSRCGWGQVLHGPTVGA